MVMPRKTDAYAAIPVVMQALVIAALIYFGRQIEDNRDDLTALKEWRNNHQLDDDKNHSEIGRIVTTQNRNSELILSLEQRLDALKDQLEKGRGERIDADKQEQADLRALRSDLSDLSATVKLMAH